MPTESTAPPEELEALFHARIAMFRVDSAASEINERFSQLLLGFAAAAIAFFAEKIHGGEAPADSLLATAAVLLCLSLLVGAGQLLLAHVAAHVRLGFNDPDVLAKVMEPLEPEAKLRVLRQAMTETLATRLWPDNILLNKALREPDLVEAIVHVIGRIRRLIQWQACLYRLQLVLAALAAIPVVMAIFA